MQKHPQFWNDVALFECYHRHCVSSFNVPGALLEKALFQHDDRTKYPLLVQFHTAPCNSALWIILQLQLTNSGIVPKVIKDKEAQNYLRCGLLVLNRQLGTS